MKKKKKKMRIRLSFLIKCVKAVKICQTFDIYIKKTKQRKKKHEAARQNTNDIWEDRSMFLVLSLKI